ncbi:flavodoxin [Maribacter sp. TH_r10]|uniref:flavodoxin family protein n=1 Tax=Maribacter sp. TH_r10 TaxID=3082086 RepID=UPI002955669E|nr:flavodoxin [Maribacter sp. TH_r10]MDV7137261.1 flavodoxin [Maribacter sp. TH_r10]
MKSLIIFFVSFSSCFRMDTREIKQSTSDTILIVFLSRTNNTRVLAEIIHDQVGGDLVALELENPYPEKYKTIVKLVAEENESGFLPALKTKVDMDKYDIIFLGFPTWGMQLPPPMKSFLAENDLSGKTVIPFNTHGGYGLGNSFKKVKELCPESTVLKGFSIKGGSERDGIFLAIKGKRRKDAKLQVKSWLNELKISTPK